MPIGYPLHQILAKNARGRFFVRIGLTRFCPKWAPPCRGWKGAHLFHYGPCAGHLGGELNKAAKRCRVRERCGVGDLAKRTSVGLLKGCALAVAARLCALPRSDLRGDGYFVRRHRHVKRVGLFYPTPIYGAAGAEVLD